MHSLHRGEESFSYLLMIPKKTWDDYPYSHRQTFASLSFLPNIIRYTSDLRSYLLTNKHRKDYRSMKQLLLRMLRWPEFSSQFLDLTPWWGAFLLLVLVRPRTQFQYSIDQALKVDSGRSACTLGVENRVYLIFDSDNFVYKSKSALEEQASKKVCFSTQTRTEEDNVLATPTTLWSIPIDIPSLRG